MPRLPLCIFGLVLGLLAAPSVEAQISRAQISRPSGNSPSSRLGRVGGATTRGQDVTSQLSRPSDRRTTDFRMNTMRPSSFNSRSVAPRLNPATYGDGVTTLGFYQRPIQSLANQVTNRSAGEAAMISGFYGAMSLGRPVVTGELRPMIPMTESSYYAPERPTPFHELFGLSQATPPEELRPPDFSSTVELLERTNAQTIDAMMLEGVRLFREATESRPDGLESLRIMARAVYVLQGVSELDPARTEPLALLLQAALTREQTATCQRLLMELVSRDPNIFADRPGNNLRKRLQDYYGDPALLRTHARRFLRYGDDYPSAERYALQAYVAWLIDDPARVREAVQRLRELNRGAVFRPGLDAVGYALLELAQAPPPVAQP